MDSDKKTELENALEKAGSLLSRRMHSCRELRDKLFKRGFSKGNIERVIEKLLDSGFLNDEEYARQYARELRGKGQSRGRILSRLRQRGLDPEPASSALDEICGDHGEELDLARKAAEKKLKSLKREKDARKRREKIYRHLRTKGFSSTVVYSTMETLDVEKQA